MDDGYFYLGQPIPEYNPNQLKGGFTTNPKQRRQAFRCASPNFQWLKMWIATITLEKCLLIQLRMKFPFISQEVMEVNDYQEVADYCDRFFDRLNMDMWLKNKSGLLLPELAMQ